MKDIGYGADYAYDHDAPDGFSGQNYFPDGMNIGYGRQQIERRGTRFVLPVQAKARIPEPYRASFDYHCRLNMPADPIGSTARADCIF